MHVCIVCQKEVESGQGVRIKEDPVIRWIRRVKQWLQVAKNNELYVCNEDYAAHLERRKKFEKNLVIFTVLAAGLTFLLIILPILSGRLDLGGILGSILIGGLIIVAVVFFGYTAGVELRETAGGTELPESPPESKETGGSLFRPRAFPRKRGG